MVSTIRYAALLATSLMFLAVPPSFAMSVNKSIDIEAGDESRGRSTVNGSISVGANARVTGDLETVNGSIRIANNCQVDDVETVNGAIKLGSSVTAANVESVNGSINLGGGTTVSGEVSVVNGRISLAEGASVGRDLSNVNGEIKLSGASVGGDVGTVSGDVHLEVASIVSGDLVVDKPRGSNWQKRPPKIVIGPDSRVDGQIVLHREVKLYISETASVGGVTGEMSMDDAIRFSGKRP